MTVADLLRLYASAFTWGCGLDYWRTVYTTMAAPRCDTCASDSMSRGGK